MHDPSTVAFTITYPWVSSTTLFKDGSKRKYRQPFITIWHEDPMNYSGKEHGRSDDSCGWHTPHLALGERDRWDKKAEGQYTQLFSKQCALARGESYAYVCYDVPDCYTAVYWLWRHFKHEYLKGHWWYRQPWQYGNRPAAGEIEAMMSLATNPVDNLQFCFVSAAHYPPGGGNSEHECFLAFYNSVHRAYRRYHRPWYRHPRWHVGHWRFQVHPWQTLRRWLFTRCSRCGKRFAYGESPCTAQWDPEPPGWFQSEKHVYHADCSDIRVGAGEARAS